MNHQLTVLYVEDDQASREIMYLLLVSEMGLSNVIIFENSSHFLSRTLELYPQPGVILLDIHVQPYNGFEMLNMLRSQPDFQATPVVALTASVMNEEVEKLRRAGCIGVIATPIDTDTFPRLLKRILSGEQIWGIFA